MTRVCCRITSEGQAQSIHIGQAVSTEVIKQKVSNNYGDICDTQADLLIALAFAVALVAKVKHR